MPTIDPVASALDTLAAALKIALDTSVAEIYRGWPEHNKQLDISSKPVGVLTAAEPERTPCNPFSVGTVASGDDLVVTYKVGALSFQAQLDLFALHRAALDDLVPLVEAALHNGLPSTPDLWLTQGSYYGRPLRFSLVSGPRRTTEASLVLEGDWRATWMLLCETDEVATSTTSKADEIETSFEFDDYGTTVQETVTVTP